MKKALLISLPVLASVAFGQWWMLGTRDSAQELRGLVEDVSALGPDTIMDDIPGDTTLREIVEAGGDEAKVREIVEATIAPIVSSVSDLQSSKADRADISAENPTFSNAVLAVTLNVGTNALAQVTDEVAQIAELKKIFDDLPVNPVTGGISIGALLSALAAAVVWLKKNALTGGLTEGVPNDPKVAALFSALAVSRSALSDKTYDMTKQEDIIRFTSDVARLLGADVGVESDSKTGSDVASDYGITATDFTTYADLQVQAGLGDSDILASLLKQ